MPYGCEIKVWAFLQAKRKSKLFLFLGLPSKFICDFVSYRTRFFNKVRRLPVPQRKFPLIQYSDSHRAGTLFGEFVFFNLRKYFVRIIHLRILNIFNVRREPLDFDLAMDPTIPLVSMGDNLRTFQGNRDPRKYGSMFVLVFRGMASWESTLHTTAHDPVKSF